MKKICLFASACFFTVSAWAAEGGYAGLDLGINNEIKLSSGEDSINDDNDLSYNIRLGYFIPVSGLKQVDIGLEGEYRSFGESFKGVLDTSADGYLVNLRLTAANSTNVYSSVILGAGIVDGKIKHFGSDRGVAYQAGVEIGYQFQKMNIGVGYRYLFTEFDSVIGDIDTELSGFNIGVGYRF